MSREKAKIAYNACYGGFSLSPEACLRLYELGYTEIATPCDEYWDECHKDTDESDCMGYRYALKEWREYRSGKRTQKRALLFLTVFTPDEKFVIDTHPRISRTDPRLIQVIEELGEAANGACAQLKIAEIPKGSKYRIDEYDGCESVQTPDDYKWEIA